MSDDNKSGEGGENPPISLVQRRTNEQQAQAADLLRNVEFLERNIENLSRAYKIQARIRKRMYDAYIEAGFNPQQALELCQNDK